MSDDVKNGVSLRMKSKSKSTVVNRIKQGATAAVGAFALVALYSYKGYANRGKDPNYDKLFKFAGSLGGVFGLFWSVTPAAKNEPSESVSSLKESIYPIVTAVAKRAADVGMAEEAGKVDDEDEDEDEGFRRRDSRRPVSTLTTSAKPGTSTSLFSERSKYGKSSFNDRDDLSFNDDDLTPSRYRL